MLTRADVFTLTDLIEVSRGEHDLPEGLKEKLDGMERRVVAHDLLTSEEAQALLDLVGGFQKLKDDEPGADDDPDREDYTDLIDRLTRIAG